jgi:hypothetical protein
MLVFRNYWLTIVWLRIAPGDGFQGMVSLVIGRYGLPKAIHLSWPRKNGTFRIASLENASAAK